MPTMETVRMRGVGSDVIRRTSNIAFNPAWLMKIGHEVDTKVGVEACADGGGGRLNPIYDW
jgi:hypothetical protein